MREEMARIGREIFLEGMTSSHGGNLSIRVGDRILITRRGSSLANLKERDIVETGLERDDYGIALASSEIGVHRSIYLNTAAQAIVHCHPPYAVALSLALDEIVPIDSEGSYLLHRVPVIATEHTVGSVEVEKLLPPVLKDYKIALLRGHGSFAIGHLLEEAYQWTSSLEASAKIFYLSRTLNLPLREYRKGSEAYKQW